MQFLLPCSCAVEEYKDVKKKKRTLLFKSYYLANYRSHICKHVDYKAISGMFCELRKQ